VQHGGIIPKKHAQPLHNPFKINQGRCTTSRISNNTDSTSTSNGTSSNSTIKNRCDKTKSSDTTGRTLNQGQMDAFSVSTDGCRMDEPARSRMDSSETKNLATNRRTNNRSNQRSILSPQQGNFSSSAIDPTKNSQEQVSSTVGHHSIFPCRKEQNKENYSTGRRASTSQPPGGASSIVFG
jgi:hypothetical protein